MSDRHLYCPCLKIAMAVAIVCAAALLSNAQVRPNPCCMVTGIDARAGVATAKVTASGQNFQFKANNPAQVNSLRTGQGVYANFKTMQVSLDGRSVFGTILPGAIARMPQTSASPSGTAAATPSGIAGPAPIPNPTASSSPPPAGSAKGTEATALPGATPSSSHTPNPNNATSLQGNSRLTSGNSAGPTLQSITIEPLTNLIWQKAKGTLNFSSLLSPGQRVLVSLQSSVPNVLSVPATLTLTTSTQVVPATGTPLQQISLPFDLQVGGALTPTSVQVTASVQLASNTGNIGAGPIRKGSSATVPAGSASTSVEVPSILAGLGALGDGAGCAGPYINSSGALVWPCSSPNPMQITLKAPAPSGGVQLSFSTQNNALQFPSGNALSIPEGAKGGAINVSFAGPQPPASSPTIIPFTIAFSGSAVQQNFTVRSNPFLVDRYPDLLIKAVNLYDATGKDITSTGPTDGNQFGLCASISLIGGLPLDPQMPIVVNGERFVGRPLNLQILYSDNHGGSGNFTIPVSPITCVDMSTGVTAESVSGSCGTMFFRPIQNACLSLPGLTKVADSYNVTLTADPTNIIQETDETNNILKMTIQRKK